MRFTAVLTIFFIIVATVHGFASRDSGVVSRCADEIPTKHCENVKKNDKCDAKFAQEKCAATCGVCDGGDSATEAPAETTTAPDTDDEDGGEVPDEMPTEPTECNAANQGRCECADGDGFTTYTFWLGDVQRCFSVFHPTAHAGKSLPVVLSMRCYAQDRLQGLEIGNTRVSYNKAAIQYGHSRVALSTPEGHWSFGNDGVVNDENPQPCSDDDSSDIPYLKKVFSFLEANPDKFDNDKIYAEGFSQNSMFSAYTAFCFPDKVRGLWQGGSGMALTGVGPSLPAMQAQCTKTSYNEHGKDCAEEDPCEDCQYWPIYPCHSSQRQMVDCIAEYTNDMISVDRKDLTRSSAEYMYNAQVAEGHDARLLRFDPSGDETIPGGHQNPKNTPYWIVGCLGITEPCSAACEASFEACVNGGDVSTAKSQSDTWEDCIQDTGSMDGCTESCAPTYGMLTLSETPTTAEFTNFGAGSGEPSDTPSDSVCQV